MSGIIKPSFGAQLNLDHPLAQGLIGCWLFNEGSGNKLYDCSGSGMNGDIVNVSNPPTPTSGWQGGPDGSALKFSTDNYHITLTDVGLRPPQITVNAWAMYDSATRLNPIFSITRAAGVIFQLAVTNLESNSLELNAYSGWWHNTWITAPPAGNWYFISGTYDGVNLNLYLNGLLQAQATCPSLDWSTFGSFYIACNAGGNGFQGQAAYTNMYNRALSAAEIAYLYAFPYCMFEEPAYPAWMIPSTGGIYNLTGIATMSTLC